MNPSLELESRLKEESARIKQALHSAPAIGLLQLLRVVDNFIYIGRIRGFNPSVAKNIGLGFPKALSILLGNPNAIPNVDYFLSTEKLETWAEAIVHFSAQVQISDFLMDVSKRSGGMVTRETEDSYRVDMGKLVGVESEVEHEARRWLEGMNAKANGDARLELNKRFPDISKEIEERVEVWKEHSISYTTSERISRYFLESAKFEMSRMDGFDLFGDEAIFGGVKFLHYKAACLILVHWALKHMAYTSALIIKVPEQIHLNQRNLLTRLIPRDGLETELAEYVGLTQSQAKQILDVFSLDISAPGELLSGYDAPHPPMIVVNDRDVLLPVSGSLIQPMIFALRKLKLVFRADWDREAQGREERFADQFGRLFEHTRLTALVQPTKIKRGRQVVTDIDQAAYDPFSGTLALFQFKWQIQTSFTSAERFSHHTNFLGTATEWIEKIETWRLEANLETFLRDSGLAQSGSVKKILLFVLGRETAQAFHNDDRDPRAAWATWPQFVQAFPESGKDDPLSDTFERLRDAGHLYGGKLQAIPLVEIGKLKIEFIVGPQDR